MSSEQERAFNSAELAILTRAQTVLGDKLRPAELRLVASLLRPGESIVALEPEEKPVRAQLLAWLCTDSKIARKVPGRRIRIQYVVVEGLLNLEFSTVKRPLEIVGCVIPFGISLIHARIPHLKVRGGIVGAVTANGLLCDGDLVFEEGVTVVGGIQLRNAEVGGDLKFLDTVLLRSGDTAFSANGMRLRGSLIANREFYAIGTVELEGASVGGEVKFNDACFWGEVGKHSLYASRLSVGGTFSCRRLVSIGSFRMVGSKIRGSLEFEGACLLDPGGHALRLDGADVGVDVRFARPNSSADADRSVRAGKPFTAFGQVALIGAIVNGDIECEGTFVGDDEISLSIARARLNGNLYLVSGFVAYAQVRLAGMDVGGFIECTDAELYGRDKEPALYAAGISVTSRCRFTAPILCFGTLNFSEGRFQQSLVLDGLRFPSNSDVKVGLNCEGASIGGNLEICAIDQFGGSFNLESVTIGRHLKIHDVRFAPFASQGIAAANLTVRGNIAMEELASVSAVLQFQSCTVGGNMVVRAMSFSAFQRTGVNLDSAKVAGELCWRDVKPHRDTRVDLTDAVVSRLNSDGEASWPLVGNLSLDGFTYGALVADDWPPQTRIRWLERQNVGVFRPQPYEQLSRVLRQSGYEDEATQVAISKYQLRRRYGGSNRVSWLWSWVLEKTLGHGYDAKPIMLIAILFVLMGTFMFTGAQARGAVLPSDELAYQRRDASALDASAVRATTGLPGGYPQFQPFIYSVDTFLPVVDLHQESYWKPVAGDCMWLGKVRSYCGPMLRSYLWLHIAVGWAMTTLLVVSMTSLVRNE